MPDTATIGHLHIRVPSGYGIDLAHRRPRVMRKRPPLTVDEPASQLFFGSGENREQLANWEAKETACLTTPTACRLRLDTLGSNIVRCREAMDDERGLSAGGYVGACRIAGADVMPFYPCDGSICEELHAIAVAGLGSYKVSATQRVVIEANLIALTGS